MKPPLVPVVSWLLLAACGAPVRSAPPGPPPAADPPTALGSFPSGEADAGPAPDDPGPRPTPTPSPADAPPVLGVVLPLSGRSRPLGEQLGGLATAWYTDEDRPGRGPTAQLADGGDPDAARAAIELLADAGAFAAVGLFDAATADAAAEAATERGLPLVMLTLSDAPLRRGGLLWRALHGPEHAGRAIAAAGLARGGRDAAVLSPRNGYGRALVAAFRTAWSQGGGRVTYAADWDPATPKWPEVARAARAAAFDTAFVADGPVGASLLLSHLATEGVWSRGLTPRFARDKNVREVVVLGTPEWYEPSLPARMGRYVEGALVPVPHAAETSEGAAFTARVQSIAGRAPTAFDALLIEALRACESAHARHLAGTSLADAFAATRSAEFTSGLRFDQPDAVAELKILEIRDGRFATVP